VSVQVLVLALLASAGAGRAEEPAARPGDESVAAARPPPTWGLHGTHDVRARYWMLDARLPNFEDRRILDYVEIVDHLDLKASSDRWTAAIRGDAVSLLANRYVLDGVLTYEHELVPDTMRGPTADTWLALEKASLEHRGQHLTLTMGDRWVSFGRGLALNLVKNTDMDIDTSLRGGHASWHGTSVDTTAVVGVTNPQQVLLENPNVRLLPDDGHVVAGVRVERFGRVALGAHAVGVQFHPPNTADAWTRPLGARVAGATVDAPGLAGIDVFAEVDTFFYDEDAIPVDRGWAAYASAGAYPGRFQVLAEVRAAHAAEYLNAYAVGYELAAGPTLEYERVITEDSAAAVNSNDIVGGRLRVDGRWGEGEHAFLPYLALAAFHDRDLGGLHFNRSPERILHPTFGAQILRGETHALLNAGVRADLREGATSDGGLDADRMAHLDLDLSFPIAGAVSLEIAPSAQAFGWGENLQQQGDFVNLSNTVAVKFGPRWALMAYNDYSDNDLIRSTGNLGEHLYGALEAQWIPTPGHTLKLFGGAYRAGIRCAGGQCRSLPGFEGVRLGYTGNF
jgi:hypothetical protein